MHKRFQQLFLWMLVVALLFGTMLPSIQAMATAQGRPPTISDSKYICTYCGAKGPVKLYRTYAGTMLKKQAATAGASSPVKITKAVNSASVQVKYRNKSYYALRGDFTAYDLQARRLCRVWTAEKALTVYRRKGSHAKFGKIAQGDKVYLIHGEENSAWIQVLYPKSVHHSWFMGWVKGQDLCLALADTNGVQVQKIWRSAPEQLPLVQKGYLSSASGTAQRLGCKCGRRQCSCCVPAERNRQAFPWRSRQAFVQE